jgi:predicted dehydrogenase
MSDPGTDPRSRQRRPLAVGVIGAGWIGAQHLADLIARPGVEPVAVADLDIGRAVGVARQFGIRAYRHHSELLAAERLDAVWVCTPPQHHLEPTLAALHHGIAVYLEKPVARTLEDAERIAAAATRAGAVCAVGYQWHALDLLDDVTVALAGQEIGCLVGRSIGPTASRPWFLQRSESGGNILERGSHHIDLVRTIAGEVKSVRAVASSVRLPHPDASGQDRPRDIDDALTLVLELESGATATIVVAWAPDGVPGTYGLDVVATGGVLHLALDPDFTLTGSTMAGVAVHRTAATNPFSRSNGRFVEAVRSADPSLVICTVPDAVRTLAVAVAAEEALATGQPVPVSGAPVP